MTARELMQQGLALHRAGDLAPAETLYRQALAVDPNFADAWHFLGTLAHQAGADDQAIQMLQRALALKPGSVRTVNNLGEAYRGLERMEDAERCFRQAIAMYGDYPEAHQNLGVVLAQAMKHDEALAEYDRAIRLQPENADAHVNRALVHLQRGRFDDGWKEYEWRHRMPAHARKFDRPMWDGSPLDGRTILVYAEQGFGDTIQFARYLPMLARQAIDVIFECPREVLPLVAASMPAVEVVAPDASHPSFDVACALMSLPLHFHTTVDTIPGQIPYLSPAPQRVAAWRERMALDQSKRKIGLAWATNALSPTARRRSCRLADFTPLAREDVSFYSLQKGNMVAEAATPPAGMRLVDVSGELHDFAETAALIANLDLVISVDTAVVHVAGAIGKPVWVLVPFASDWRWLLGREDSPWYPSARLFRQETPGQWPPVVAALADLLKAQHK